MASSMMTSLIIWKHFPRYWPFVRGIHRRPVNSPHKGQWRGALMFTLICVWISDWINNREAGDLRRHLGHYDVTVMLRRNFGEFWVEIQMFSLAKMPLKISSGEYLPFCFGLNMNEATDLNDPGDDNAVGVTTVQSALTHWGRVTHICVDDLSIIGTDNGLAPGRCQPIIWTSAGISSI